MIARRWLKPDALILAACLLAVLVLYPTLHGIYRPDNGDDAWTLAFLHNYWVRGVEADTVFGNAFRPGTQNGVELFGKTQALLYGPVLDACGWSRSAAQGISAALLALAALTWGWILFRLTRDQYVAIGTGLMFLLLEPFFGAANSARPEALTFLLASLAAACAVRRFFLTAGILVLLAVEVHPMGLIALAYVAAFLLAGLFVRRDPTDRRAAWRALGSALLWLSAGGLLGIAYYILLHHAHLDALRLLLPGNPSGETGNTLSTYFFRTQYFRHLPELAAILIGAALFYRDRLYREYPWLLPLVGITLVFMLALGHANFQYALYVYPALFPLLLVPWSHRRKTGWALALLLLLLLPQYTYVYARHHAGRLDPYLAELRQALPADGQPILGHPSSWFAFQDRPFYATDYDPRAFVGLGFDRFHLVEDESFRTDTRYARLRAVLPLQYRCTVTRELKWCGRKVVIKNCVRQSPRPR